PPPLAGAPAAVLVSQHPAPERLQRPAHGTCHGWFRQTRSPPHPSRHLSSQTLRPPAAGARRLARNPRLSDNTPDAGDTAEKRVRKPRASKADASAASKTESAAADNASPAPAKAAPAAAPAAEPKPAPVKAEAPAAPAQDNQGSAGASGEGQAEGQRPPRNGGEPRSDNAPRDGQSRDGHPRDGQRGDNAPRGGDQEGGRGNRRDRFRNKRDRNRNRDGLPSDDGGNETFVPRPNPQVPEGFPSYSLGDLKRMPAQKLLDIAEQLNISEGVARARKQDVIFAVLKVLTR